MKRKSRTSNQPRALTTPRPTPGSAEGDESTVDADLEIQRLRSETDQLSEPLGVGMQRTREMNIEDVERHQDANTYSRRATGSAPKGEEGQGNRQSDETAELQQIEPDLDPYRSPR